MNFTDLSVSASPAYTPPFDMKEDMAILGYLPTTQTVTQSFMPSPPCSVPEHQQQQQQQLQPFFNTANMSSINIPHESIETNAIDIPSNFHNQSTSVLPVHLNDTPLSLNSNKIDQQLAFAYTNETHTINQQSNTMHHLPGLHHGTGTETVDPKQFQDMSREELIARLVTLEKEKQTVAEEETEQEAVHKTTAMTLLLDEEELIVEPTIVCLWADCGEKCDDLQSLTTHLGEAHVGSGKPTYRCEWENCPRINKPFTKRHKMFNHLRTHTGERPFACPKPDCNKKFSRPDSLTTHIKTHSNIRPFICKYKGCGKAYYHARSLKKHEKLHETTITIDATGSLLLPPQLPLVAPAVSQTITTVISALPQTYMPTNPMIGQASVQQSPTTQTFDPNVSFYPTVAQPTYSNLDFSPSFDNNFIANPAMMPVYMHTPLPSNQPQ